MQEPQSPSQGAGRQVFLETFGCQMNELDSELVKGQLGALGYRFTSDPQSADVILFNTCSVREQAENKVLSRVGRVGQRKRRGARVVLGVIGCMAERYGVAMLTKYPQIDLMCGPGELDKLPLLIENAVKTGAVEAAEGARGEAGPSGPLQRVALQGNRTRRSATLSAAADNLELLDLSRSFDPDSGGGPAARRNRAYVRITRGCNKYCTYCVVPYTRGPEVHRPPDRIVEECRRLADQGVIEITLLGQTVNHYLYTHGASITVGGAEAPQIGPGASAFTGNGASGGRRTTFADLLRRIHDEVPGIRRLRFVTSYARDFGDDVLRAMADCRRICRYLHLPAQSGSDRILKLMNRGYSRSLYVDLIDRARALLPGVCIAGDIIVGFPTETEADFELTRDLLRRVRYKNCFIFKYSPRPGTAAARRLADDVPEAVKRRRNRELLALQAEIGGEVHRELVGREVEVFVEQVSPHQPRRAASQATGGRRGPRVELGWERPGIQMSGRTEGDLITVFDLTPGQDPDDLIGRMVTVEITGSGSLVLEGRLAPTPANGVRSQD